MTIAAKYENGVFKPLEDVKLTEGARVEVHTPRRIITRTVAPAMGFMAQSESALTFGLGEDTRVRKIVIHWPSGQRQELRPDAINRTLVIREP